MFLIVAIAVAYLRKTGREALLPAVAWGTVTAVAASVVLGVWLAETAVTPKWESLLALIAGRRWMCVCVEAQSKSFSSRRAVTL